MKEAGNPELAQGSPVASAKAATPRRQKPRRWLPYAGAALLLALIIAGLWPKPIPVELAPVTQGHLRVTVDEEGRTRVRQRYVVYAPVAGQLRRPPFKAGADVVGGQTVVAVIDPLPPAMLDVRTRTTAEARRETAAARLAKAKAEVDYASAELKRFQKLYEANTVSTQELDAATLRNTAAERSAAAAASELRQAEAELAEFAGGSPANDQKPREILAPATGKVLRVFEESARSVTAGMPLLEIGEPADLEIVIETLSRDGAIIQPGMTVDLEQWGGGEPLRAIVRLVEPGGFTKISALGVEEQRVNVIADLQTPPEKRGNLGDGFRVEARIVVWEEANALKVPAGALFRQGTNWAAYVVEGGHARLRPVEAGRTSGAETKIIKGLSAGEQVIVYPGSRVRDGSRVRPIRV